VTTSKTVRRIAGAALAALLAVAPVPASAAEATTLWGVVPPAARDSAAQVVGEKVGGERVGALPAPTDGRFVFANLAAGDYVVRLVDAAGQTVAQSQVARVQPETSTEARFEDQYRPAGVFPAGGSGSSKTLLIAGAAAAAGVGVGLLINSDEPRPASPSR
jgi:hypothetical protein